MREALRQASEAGLNVLRTFAHTTDDNFPFQVGMTAVHSHAAGTIALRGEQGAQLQGSGLYSALMPAPALRSRLGVSDEETFCTLDQNFCWQTGLLS